MRNLPVPDPELRRKFKAFVSDYVKKNYTPIQRMSFEEWLEGAPYTTQRKDQLREVYQELRGSHPTRDQAKKIDSFVKSEFYPTWKHARLINSRNDMFKAWSGPFFKAIENELYKHPAFIKHTPVPDRPAKIAALKKAGRRFFATDFTAYESHFEPDFMRDCECQLYRHLLGEGPDTEFLIAVITGQNELRTRTGLKAKLKGRRMSGEMNTSAGNGFSNKMLLLFNAAENGVYEPDIEFYVEGDDGIISTPVELVESIYTRLGFTIKLQEIDDPCKASFCGMVFAESGEIIKNPYQFLQGFGWTSSFINAGPKIMDELLRAKALSAVYETPQCPIIGAFARYALSKTSHVHPRFISDGYHVLPDVREVPAFRPNNDTRLLFEELYGISIPLQLLIESAAARGEMSEVACLLPPPPEVEEFASKYVVVT
jgi:hypothetical protein